MRLHAPKLINVLSFVLFATSAAILVGVVVFTVNIDVLTNWNLALPSGDIHAGDTVLIESTYTKLRAVTGTAHRYLDCENGTNSFIRYAINQAVADHAPGGKTGTGITLKIPTDVPDLPATCRVSVNVVYKVYPWRSVTEFNSTKDFTLLPALSAAPAVVSEVTTQTNQSLVVDQGQVSGSASSPSSSQPTTTPTPAQSNIQQPGVVMRVVTSVTSLLKRLF